jgi:heptosyltransferase-3
MDNNLIPQATLAQANKILIIGHFALGDFTYLQNYFSALAKQNPQLKVHVWVDEVRRSWKFWEWQALKNYVLYDWLATCPFIEKVYSKTYSPPSFTHSITQARAENYDIVVSLSIFRCHRYARLARRISPQGFVVALKEGYEWYQPIKKAAFKCCNAVLAIDETVKPGQHISDRYALWFERLFGLVVPKAERFPFITIPNQWMAYAKLLFLKWGIGKANKKFGRVIFINPFAKTSKRSWPLEKVLELIIALCRKDEYGDVSFVVNAVPEELTRVRAFFSKHSLNNTFLFSAEANFFQLPAVLSLCDLVISVETSIMHFASALHVPVVALMRQKNPEWVPIDTEKSLIVLAKKRSSFVSEIPVQEVLYAIEQIKPLYMITQQKNLASTIEP